VRVGNGIDIHHINKNDANHTWFIAVISNPIRWQSRIELYRDFEKHVLSSGANLITVEAAFGNRPFVITSNTNPNHLQFRTFDELWHKENMINLAIQRMARLDPMWEKVGWLDADIRFMREDWVNETVQQLEHYMVVQMWSEAVDLSPNFEIHQRQKGFAWCWHENQFQPDDGIVNGPNGTYGFTGKKFYWHPGFAWAYRREAIEGLGNMAGGPLIDYPCIVGAADHHMALALIGKSDQSYPKNIHPNYIKAIQQWEDAALRVVKKDIGFVPGVIGAGWHGNKVHRFYWSRWDILKEFNPETDLRKDSQGLFQLVVEDERQRMIRDRMRGYFRSRNEDSVDVIENFNSEIRKK
jgi:hypothetical protein